MISLRKAIALIVLLLTLLVLLLAGCAKTGSAPPKQSPPSPPSPPITKEPGIYPQEVMDLLEAVRPLMVGTSIVVGDETFIIVSYGQKPTAGYNVRVTKITTEGNRAEVTTELTGPEEMAAQVITYPNVVEVLKGKYTQIEFKDSKGEYIPRIVGAKGPLKPVKSSNNIRVTAFGYDPTIIYVSGIARVFEGNVSYELQDEKGKVLSSGFVQAAAGGPDWGYFNLEIRSIPDGTAKIVLFQESAKDGSHVDQVEFEIKTGRK